MKYFFNISLLILTILLWGGCFGSSSFTPPSWFANNSKDNSVLVGFGSAKTLDTAKANALNDIIAQINVSVQSQLNISTQRENTTINHRSSNDIWIDSSSIELNSVQYTKSALENNLYYDKAEIPKASLIRQFQKSFNDEFNMLNAGKIGQCQTLSAKEYVTLSQSLEKLQSYALYLNVLKQSTKSLTKFENLLAQNSPLPPAKLLINSNLRNSIAENIIENDLLEEYGHFYAINAKAQNTLKNDVQISVNGNEVKVLITLTILDCMNNPSLSTSATYTHRASKQEEALRFASKRVSVQLYKKIQEWIQH